jgi:methionine-rich copper-binding protein CopC
MAHTSVAESNPADGTSVEAIPAQVTVRFGQEAVPAPAQVSDARLEVYDACGTQVDKKDSALNMQDSSVSVSAEQVPVAGRYEIHWFATASDGEAQAGVLDFNVTKGEPCTKVAWTDEADDTEGGPDAVSVQTRRTRKGGVVTVGFNDRISCAALGSEAEERLSMQLDTNSDRAADFTGDVTCKSGQWSMTLTSAEGEETGRIAMTRPSAKTLRALLPKQKLVAHVDIWVEASSEATDCEGKVCFDRAPELGLARAY